MNSAQKIFVTGGTGFLGAYIIRELVERGYAVKALRRTPMLPNFIPATVFEKVEWINGNILDTGLLETALEGTDMVIHCAAVVSFSPKAEAEMFRTNIDGTANVVNAALLNHVKKFVYISSVAALGRTSNGETVTESKQWEENGIHTQYARSKFSAEMEVWRGMGEGLEVVVLNPSTILGYGNWNNSSCAIFRNIYREFPWFTNGINGFVSVEDVARATLLLMESGVRNERFIVSAENWTFGQLFNCIAGAFGKKAPKREATPALAALAWRMEKLKSFFTGKPSLLTRESARISQSITYFDNRKILNALPGFSFTPLEVCIRNACNHYLQYL